MTNSLIARDLARLIRPKLTPSSATNGTKPRIVVISSVAHKMFCTILRWDDFKYEKEDEYQRHKGYGESKTMNILYGRKLAREERGKVTVVIVHPGGIYTNLMRHESKDDLLRFSTSFAINLAPRTGATVADS